MQANFSSLNNIGRASVFAALALLALAVRLPQLGLRPMHTDEAVNAYITGQLLAGEPYCYDQRDRHGPALSAVALPVVRALGARTFPDLTETELRLVPVLIGVVTVLLFWAGAGLFGFGPSMIAAVCFAFAALPVYYSRYFIHETLFAAATLALILSGLRTVKSNSLAAAGLAGLSAALLLACKETAVLHFFALGVAALVALRAGGRGFATRLGLRNAVFAITVFIGVFIVLFTWFGQHPRGLDGLLQAVPRVIRRAGGEGHEKPFWYYAVLLGGGWSGAIFLILAAVGIGSAFRATDNPWHRARLFIAGYAVVVAAIYSAIPYKTPWLALNLLLPISIMAGVGIERLWNLCNTVPRQVSACLAALALAGLMAHDTLQRVFVGPADPSNPYAYAHTVVDLLRLEPRLAQLARERNQPAPRISVVAADPWPLPWYLRKFPNTGFWQPGQETGPVDYYITTPDAMKNPDARLARCRPEFFGLRPEAVVILWIPVTAGDKP